MGVPLVSTTKSYSNKAGQSLQVDMEKKPYNPKKNNIPKNTLS